MMRNAKFLFSVLVLLLFRVSVYASVQEGITDPIKVDGGQISGAVTQDGAVRSYKGIPFAAPPVGELRWKPPADVVPWDGVKACTEFGPGCLQVKPAIPLPGLNPPKMGEDCLYLNIWTPAKSAGEKLPVMYWIHGGGFTMGSAGVGMYDGEALARKGVMLVTVNYRLGPFGFFAHPLLTKESPQGASGNYGLLDQIAGLQWVQRNIAKFGGDPDRVTIFGESAGGVSVSMLMVSPLAKGLFARAIAESGSAALLPTRHHSKTVYGMESMESQGEAMAKTLACDAAADPLAAMRAKSADEILAAQPKSSFEITNVFTTKAFPWWPIVDGWCIPEDPAVLFTSGKQHKVPFMVGTNADEGTMFVMMIPVKDVATYQAMVKDTFKNYADDVLKIHPVDDVSQLKPELSELLTNGLFIRPARMMAASMPKAGGKAYYYHFTKTHKTGFGSNLGAHHAAEIPYVFCGLTQQKINDPADLTLSEQMSSYWVNFSTNGDPNGKGLPEWPTYDPAKDQHLELGEKVQVQSRLRQASVDLIDKIMSDWQTKRDKPLGG